MSWRLWIGVWIFIIGLVHLACEASFLIRYVTRFTEEILASLIALIFIYETVAFLVKVRVLPIYRTRGCHQTRCKLTHTDICVSFEEHHN